MDVYDAGFMVDYLRDWAAKLNRIVLVAANPPTFQLLAMFRKGPLFTSLCSTTPSDRPFPVAAGVLASGQLVYMGPSVELPAYFTALDFPCPLFKNPCDYYGESYLDKGSVGVEWSAVDLVTQDDLTLEAGAESAERIRRLAELWGVRGAAGEAPPPGAHNPFRSAAATTLRKAGLARGTLLVYWKLWLLFLNAAWGVGRELAASLGTSLWMGVLFYGLTTAHPGGIR